MSELKEPLVIFSLEKLGVLKRFTSMTDVRVLVAVLDKVGSNNIIWGNQTTIAAELGISRQDVCRSFKSLCDWGIFLKSCESGVKLHRLNPAFGIKGQTLKKAPEKKSEKTKKPTG